MKLEKKFSFKPVNSDYRNFRKKFTICGIVLVCLMLFSHFALALDIGNLKTYYKFNDASTNYLTDSVGNGSCSTTTYNNDVYSGTGKIGNSFYSKAGPSNTLETLICEPSVLDNNWGEDFTISFWYKRSSYPTSSLYLFTSITTNKSSIMISDPYGELSFRKGTYNAITRKFDYEMKYCSIDTSANNVWYHVVLDSDQNIKINGIYCVNTSSTGSFSEMDNFVDKYFFMWIGNSLDYDRNVSIDEFSVWNTVLSDLDKNVLYNSGTGVEIDFALPTTTMSYSITPDTNTATITLTCTDDFACDSTQYRIDGGAWQNYTAPFDFNATGLHTIDYNSTDTFGNMETTNTDTLGMPVVLTIKKPKNELTLLEIDANFNVTLSGGNTSIDVNLTGDRNYYITANTTILVTSNASSPAYNQKTYLAEFDGNTNVIIQPYLLPTDDSAAIKFIVLNEYNNSIEGIQIDLYKYFSGVKTNVASATSDTTGTAIFYLNVGSTYSILMSYQDVNVYSTDNYVVTSTPVYFYINLSSFTTLDINFNPPNVVWNVGTETIPASTTILTATITDANDVQLIYYQYLNGNSGDRNVLAVTQAYCSTGNVCVINRTLSTLGIDTNKPFFVDVYAWNDENKLSLFIYRFVYNTTTRNIVTLFQNVRADFGCSTNPNYPCGATLMISVLLVIGCVAGLMFFLGFGGGLGSVGISVIALIVLALLTYIGWFYWVLFVIIVALIILANLKGFTGGGVNYG